MSHKRTMNRATQLFTILALVTQPLLVAASPVHSSGTWTDQSASPSARYFHAMASLGGDQVLLFGGFDGAYNDETWVYDLSDNTWTNQAPAAGPSARSGHAMAHLAGDQVLLFGGYDGIDPNGESWVYDLSDNTWTNKTPAAGPSAWFGHALAALGADRVLLFGGYEGIDYSNETWLATGFFTDWHRTYLPLVAR